jgi:endonuclease III
MPHARSRLEDLIERLRALYGKPAAPPLRDPYLLLLWEQVGYLADDGDRLAAYRLLEERVGTKPAEILAATTTELNAVARRGGSIAVTQRAERLRQVARRVAAVWHGNLRPVLRLPFVEARRELSRYPAIGEPGAERILLLCGAHPVLALDSNALRVLQRLGYGREQQQWARTYRSVQATADPELPPSVAARRTAFLLLRQHGQTLCRRSRPRCVECPLQPDCPAGHGQIVDRSPRAR